MLELPVLLLPRQRTPDLVPDATGWVALASHRRRLLALALACGCHPDEAHDVVQDAMLKVGVHPATDPDCTQAYLDSVVRRLVVDRHRQQQRRLRLSHQTALRPQPLPSHEDQICERAEAAWLWAATARLRPRERHAVLARACGRTPTQIALELGTTVKAVELLTRRGRQTLKALMRSGAY